MTGVNDLAKMVPGFEFLQSLMKSAAAGMPGVPGMPGIGKWVAPTLDPEELDKRIQELKTVQFWLDSNAKLLGTTIQALEVQRMTLSTLQTMNLPMAELREALSIKMPTAAAPTAPAPAATSRPLFTPPAPPATASAPSASAAARDATPDAASDAATEPPAEAPAAAAATAAVDPMQWWGALTQQFTELATRAVKDSSAALVPGAVQPRADKAAKATKAASGAKATKGSKPEPVGRANSSRARTAATKSGAKSGTARKAAAPRKRS